MGILTWIQKRLGLSGRLRIDFTASDGQKMTFKGPFTGALDDESLPQLKEKIKAQVYIEHGLVVESFDNIVWIYD